MVEIDHIFFLYDKTVFAFCGAGSRSEFNWSLAFGHLWCYPFLGNLRVTPLKNQHPTRLKLVKALFDGRHQKRKGVISMRDFMSKTKKIIKERYCSFADFPKLAQAASFIRVQSKAMSRIRLKLIQSECTMKFALR